MHNIQTPIFKNKIMQVYILFGVALFLSLLPSPIAASISLMVLCAVMIAAYTLRRGYSDIDMTHNHMTYIIRTMWYSGIMALISLCVACLYMILTIDSTVLNACLNGTEMSTIENMSTEQALEFFSPCMDEFMQKNKGVILTSGMIATVPVLFYMVFRFIKGLKSARAGQMIDNLKSWL